MTDTPLLDLVARDRVLSVQTVELRADQRGHQSSDRANTGREADVVDDNDDQGLDGERRLFQALTDIVQRLFDYFSRVVREILTLDASFDRAENFIHFLIAVTDTLTRLEHSIEAYFALFRLYFKIFTPRCLGIRLKSMFETVEFLGFFFPIFKL